MVLYFLIPYFELRIFLESTERMEYHQNQLAKYCKVRGKVVKGYAYSVNSVHSNLLVVAGTDTSPGQQGCAP